SDSAEALGANYLLLVEPAIRPAKLRVTLLRDVAESKVVRHFLGLLLMSICRRVCDDSRSAREAGRCYRFPRRSCSRSMASNSALKLPAPKERAPLRWMIS